MSHNLPRAASFWLFLFAVDKDLAEGLRKQACPCGGRLHDANYLRKPRGTPAQLPEPLRLRLSFCCDRDGCRKRATPPSVRFLGRKVFLGAIVILVSAMRQGLKPRRVRPSAWSPRRLGTAALFSLADHDPRGPPDQRLMMLATGPQKMLVEHSGWPVYQGHRSSFTRSVRRCDDPNRPQFDRRFVGALPLRRRGCA